MAMSIRVKVVLVAVSCCVLFVATTSAQTVPVDTAAVTPEVRVTRMLAEADSKLVGELASMAGPLFFGYRSSDHHDLCGAVGLTHTMTNATDSFRVREDPFNANSLAGMTAPEVLMNSLESDAVRLAFSSSQSETDGGVEVGAPMPVPDQVSATPINSIGGRTAWTSKGSRTRVAIR